MVELFQTKTLTKLGMKFKSFFLVVTIVALFTERDRKISCVLSDQIPQCNSFAKNVHLGGPCRSARMVLDLGLWMICELNPSCPAQQAGNTVQWCRNPLECLKYMFNEHLRPPMQKKELQNCLNHHTPDFCCDVVSY